MALRCPFFPMSEKYLDYAKDRFFQTRFHFIGHPIITTSIIKTLNSAQKKKHLS
jgi:hypothetical protein